VAETVTISALGHGGDGIAESVGQRIFVPYTLAGETVEIEREGERGTLVRVVAASPDRVAPLCRHFGSCGTCAIEHMARPAYLAWKRDQVVAAFAQRGIEAAVEPIVPIAPGSRRRAIFSAIRTAKGTVFGFHARHSDEIVAITECPVLAPAMVAKIPAFTAIANVVLSRWKPARVTVFLADNGFDIAITGAGKPNREMLEKLGAFGTEQSLARLTVDGLEVVRTGRRNSPRGRPPSSPRPAASCRRRGRRRRRSPMRSPPMSARPGRSPIFSPALARSPFASRNGRRSARWRATRRWWRRSKPPRGGRPTSNE